MSLSPVCKEDVVKLLKAPTNGKSMEILQTTNYFDWLLRKYQFHYFFSPYKYSLCNQTVSKPIWTYMESNDLITTQQHQQFA